MTSVEGRLRSQWAVRDDGASPVGRRAGELAVEAFHVAQAEVCRLGRTKQMSVGIRAIGAQPNVRRQSLLICRHLSVVRQMSDLAGRIDRGLTVDLHSIAGAVSDSRAHREITP